jgi:hypothetical protein
MQAQRKRWLTLGCALPGRHLLGIESAHSMKEDISLRWKSIWEVDLYAEALNTV